MEFLKNLIVPAVMLGTAIGAAFPAQAQSGFTPTCTTTEGMKDKFLSIMNNPGLTRFEVQDVPPGSGEAVVFFHGEGQDRDKEIPTALGQDSFFYASQYLGEKVFWNTIEQKFPGLAPVLRPMMEDTKRRGLERHMGLCLGS